MISQKLLWYDWFLKVSADTRKQNGSTESTENLDTIDTC